MPNTTALLTVAQTAAKTGAQLLAPSAAAAAAGATAGTVGTILGAAVPILGLAAVAAPFVSNLFSCGTISNLGCVKRNDAAVQSAAMLQARQIAYAVETGQITPAQGSAAIQQILQTAPAQFERSSDWNVAPSSPVDVWCGTHNNIPSSAYSSKIDCNVIASPQQIITDLLTYVQSVTPPAGSPAAQQLDAANPITAVTDAASAATGLPGWLVLAGLGVGLYFLVN